MMPADMSERHQDVREVACELGAAASGFEPGARLVGNVRAEDIARVCARLLELVAEPKAPEASSGG